MGSSNSKEYPVGQTPAVRRRRSSTLTFKSSKSSSKEPSEWEQAQTTLSSNMLLLQSASAERDLSEFCDLKLSNAECYTKLQMPGKAFIEVADIFARLVSCLQEDLRYEFDGCFVSQLKSAVDHIPLCDSFSESRTRTMHDDLDKLAEQQPTVYSDEITSLTVSFAELFNHHGLKNESLSVYKTLIERYMHAMHETKDDADRRVYAEKALDISQKISVT